MTASFVDALADAIVGRLRAEAQADASPAASRAPPRARRGGRPPDPLALEPTALERVASAVVAQLAELQSQQELPLDRIEI